MKLLAVLVLVVLLAGCQKGTRQLVVEEIPSAPGDSVVVDPEHAQTESPVSYRLFEEAWNTGSSWTADPDEIEEIRRYLRDVSGVFENTFRVEYEEKYFHVATQH